jgi:hypothetical protein
MYKTAESGNDLSKGYEYVADFRDVHICNHHFVRVDDKIQCTNCGVGYMDSPTDPFPIDELNEFFDNKQNQEYFRRNPT